MITLLIWQVLVKHLVLLLCMVLFAKSAQFKQLGKLAVVPDFFNINEPILFGTPIVMNPIMAVPFIITPVVTNLITYLCNCIRISSTISGVLVPWTTPPIISGFILGGPRMAVLQVVIMNIILYLLTIL